MSKRSKEILDAAARLFGENGYDATGIRDIAKAVGINSASLYYHYKNKDEILCETACYGVRMLQDAVETAMLAERTLLNQLYAGVVTHIDTILSHQALARVLLHESQQLTREFAAQVITARDRYEQLWMNKLHEGVTLGVIQANLNLHLTRLLCFGAANWAITWYRSDGQYTPQEIANTLFNLLAPGFLTAQAQQQWKERVNNEHE